MFNILRKGNWEGFKKHPSMKQTVENALHRAAERMEQNMEKTRFKIEIDKLEVATMGCDYKLPSDLIYSIVTWLSWKDKCQFQLVCSTFNVCIAAQKNILFTDWISMWNWLGVPYPPKKPTRLAPIIAVHLRGKYTWDDFISSRGRSDFSSRMVHTSKLKLEGIDLLINNCLKKHKIKFQIRGMMSDSKYTTIVHDHNEPNDIYYKNEVVAVNDPGHIFCAFGYNISLGNPSAKFMYLIFAISNPFYEASECSSRRETDCLPQLEMIFYDPEGIFGVD